MALKIYELNGLTYQFDEANVPTGAVEVSAKEAPKPANKSRVVRNKAVKRGGDTNVSDG